MSNLDNNNDEGIDNLESVLKTGELETVPKNLASMTQEITRIHVKHVRPKSVCITTSNQVPNDLPPRGGRHLEPQDEQIQ